MLEAPAVAALTILILSLFVGVEVISKVPPLLHTPLMSGSNAISGISVVGAILAAGGGNGQLSTILGFIAIALAMFNVVGGFLVTNRMLAMFKKKPTKS
jgi:NAD(P) transhydrogenase subunit alpha